MDKLISALQHCLAGQPAHLCHVLPGPLSLPFLQPCLQRGLAPALLNVLHLHGAHLLHKHKQQRISESTMAIPHSTSACTCTSSRGYRNPQWLSHTQHPPARARAIEDARTSPGPQPLNICLLRASCMCTCRRGACFMHVHLQQRCLPRAGASAVGDASYKQRSSCTQHPLVMPTLLVQVKN